MADVLIGTLGTPGHAADSTDYNTVSLHGLQNQPGSVTLIVTNKRRSTRRITGGTYPGAYRGI